MNRVYQTKFAPPDGNCVQACVASILELPIDAVPNFVGEKSDEWYFEALKWLRPANLQLQSWLNPEWPQWMAGGWYGIAGVKSFHGDWTHVVVARDGVIVHDPNPKNTDRPQGDYTVLDWTIFAVTDPAQPIRLDLLGSSNGQEGV